MFRCIGQQEVNGKLVRCERESEVPSVIGRPEFGWLCSDCANASPRKGSRNRTGFATLNPDEEVNVGALQVDPDEYRDQAESSFAAGIRRSAVLDSDYYEED